MVNGNKKEQKKNTIETHICSSKNKLLAINSKNVKFSGINVTFTYKCKTFPTQGNNFRFKNKFGCQKM